MRDQPRVSSWDLRARKNEAGLGAAAAPVVAPVASARDLHKGLGQRGHSLGSERVWRGTFGGWGGVRCWAKGWR